jgi:hypothetical protein
MGAPREEAQGGVAPFSPEHRHRGLPNHRIHRIISENEYPVTALDGLERNLKSLHRRDNACRRNSISFYHYHAVSSLSSLTKSYE